MPYCRTSPYNILITLSGQSPFKFNFWAVPVVAKKATTCAPGDIWVRTFCGSFLFACCIVFKVFLFLQRQNVANVRIPPRRWFYAKHTHVTPVFRIHFVYANILIYYIILFTSYLFVFLFFLYITFYGFIISFTWSFTVILTSYSYFFLITY